MADIYHGVVDDTSTLGRADVIVEVLDDPCLTCEGSAMIFGDRLCPNCTGGKVATVEITVTRINEEGTETDHELVLSMAEAREVCIGLVSGLR